MNLTFDEKQREKIEWSHTQVEVLIQQYKDINSRLWNLTIAILIESVSIIGVLLTLIITG